MNYSEEFMKMRMINQELIRSQIVNKYLHKIDEELTHFYINFKVEVEENDEDNHDHIYMINPLNPKFLEFHESHLPKRINPFMPDNELWEFIHCENSLMDVPPSSSYYGCGKLIKKRKL